MAATSYSPDPHDDLTLGAPLDQVFKRFLRLLEREYLIDHRTNAFRFEEYANFRELGAIRAHEEKRMVSRDEILASLSAAATASASSLERRTANIWQPASPRNANGSKGKRPTGKTKKTKCGLSGRIVSTPN